MEPRAKRRRSAAWWGVFLSALLLVGAYVCFDLLDVDGSQLSRWTGHEMMVVATPEVAAERFLRASLATPGAADLVALALTRARSPEPDKISPRTRLFRMRQVSGLPRLNLVRERGPVNTPTGEPAQPRSR